MNIAIAILIFYASAGISFAVYSFVYNYRPPRARFLWFMLHAFLWPIFALGLLIDRLARNK